MGGLYLQNRWQLEDNKLVYYGMRNLPNLNKNVIKLNKKQVALLNQIILDRASTADAKIEKLVEQKILVEKSSLRSTPKSIEEAIFCKECAANDFILPGLEFDENGRCPMCQSKTELQSLVAVMPVKQNFEKNKKGRFDVALFYTGGKDSHFLLHHFSKVLKLRVLALTWETPFMSNCAKESLENAKRKYENVEFVSRFISPSDLNKFYKKLVELQNNTCACPSLAYVLFYPTLVTERIPYLVLGHEPAQMKALYFNGLAPKMSYKFQDKKILYFLYNILRVLTLKKPIKKGQLEMLMLIKQLAYGDHFVKKLAGYENETVSNVCTAMDEIDNLKRILKKNIRLSNRRGNIPALVHFDMDQCSEGENYSWEKTKDTLIEQAGWVCPRNFDKLLHTSCCVETAKDYSQFIRFYNMESRVMPFSSIEICLASSMGNVSREKAIAEIKQNLGVSLNRPLSHKIMLNCDGHPLKQDEMEY